MLRAILIPILNEAIALISTLTVNCLKSVIIINCLIKQSADTASVTVPNRPILTYIITCVCVPDYRAAMHFPSPHKSQE